MTSPDVLLAAPGANSVAYRLAVYQARGWPPARIEALRRAWAAIGVRVAGPAPAHATERA